MKRSYDDWKDADMRCPFFRTQNSQARRIGCEGLLPRSTIIHTFLRQGEYNAFLSQYCAAHYRQCPYYRILMKEKYEDNE